MTFRIYYSDHSVIAAVDDIVPARDVQVILQHDDKVGWTTLSGSDYYIRRDERWIGVDIFGLFDFLLESGLVLFGRTITNREFLEIYQQAKSDKNLMNKNAFLPGERQPDLSISVSEGIGVSDKVG